MLELVCPGFLEFSDLEIFLGLLNDFSLVELIDFKDIFFWKVLKTFATKEKNLKKFPTSIYFQNQICH
jgi:hypothetical protein